MTDTGAELLAQVIERPGEDAIRLVYADWLEEFGEGERAEFIRVQVELAKKFKRGVSGRGVSACRHLRARERELLYGPKFPRDDRLESHADEHGGFLVPRRITDNHAVRWFLGDFMRYMEFGHPQYRRGFVESVTCSAASWLEFGDRIRACHPVTSVTLTTRPDWCHRNCAVYLYEGLPPGIGEIKGRKCRQLTTDDHVGDIERRISYVEGVLRAEWPGMTFTLPPPSGTFGTMTVGGVTVPISGWHIGHAPPA